MSSDDTDRGLVETIIENVRQAFGGYSLADNELSAEARGERAGDTSGTEADVNMFDTAPDRMVLANVGDRAQSGASGPSSIGPTFETTQSGSGFARPSADPYANTPGTGFATGMVPTPVETEPAYGNPQSGISTEPSLGEGDAGVTGAPVDEDITV